MKIIKTDCISNNHSWIYNLLVL